tara:strand:+ start:1354 stop:1554 length:201 start_codon:yes stop_codon:yes gene_type:complete
MEKKMYTVTVEQACFSTIDIEAENEMEARQIATDMDSIDLEELRGGVYEISDEAHSVYLIEEQKNW